MRLLSLLAVALLVAGCDSTDDDRVLDADFYVGTWTLASVSDASGDQTASINDSIDDLSVEFASDGTFQLDADFNDLINASGQGDISTVGTYQARSELESLILQADGLAATLQVEAASDDRVTLTAPAVIVNALLAGLPFSFEGDTSLTITRQ